MATRVWQYIFLLPVTLAAQPDDIVARAKRHIAQSLSTLPNYTCLETIERLQSKPPARKLRRFDSLKLEVARVNGKEMFSWPGGNGFEERPISDFASGGLIGDGTYGLFAEDVFRNNAATMKLVGPDRLGDREAIRVDYTVSILRGKFLITAGGASAEVGYSGSYWVTPDTLDLLRMDIAADDLPPELQLVSAKITITYSAVSVEGRGVTLPQSSRFELAKISGDVSDNRIEFANCRQFGGESKLLTDVADTDETPALAASASQIRTLPPNLSISLRLQKPIEGDRASVGDLVTATVQSSVSFQRQVLVPKGSLVRGRIRRLEHHYDGLEYVLAGIEFYEVEVKGETLRFISELGSIDSGTGRTDFGPTGDLDRMGQPVTIGMAPVRVSAPPADALRGVGYLDLVSSPFRIPATLRMTWKTGNYQGKTWPAE